MGDDGPSEERILCRVLARSLPAIQLLAKSELPNGLDVPSMFGRCGIDPALRRDSKAALLLLRAAPAATCCSNSPGELDPEYGPLDGVGRPAFDAEFEDVPIAGNRDGTVPALVRRVEFDGDSVDGLPLDGGAASKSGKLSLLGDSGIVSLRGVEWPLPVVGGPQICGERPSCC